VKHWLSTHAHVVTTDEICAQDQILGDLILRFRGTALRDQQGFRNSLECSLGTIVDRAMRRQYMTRHDDASFHCNVILMCRTFVYWRSD
jgi:hypothetical protein